MRLCMFIYASSCPQNLTKLQTFEIHNPTRNRADSPLPALPHSFGTIQNRFSHINCGVLDHPMGFPSHPAQDMDLPLECYYWADTL